MRDVILLVVGAVIALVIERAWNAVDRRLVRWREEKAHREEVAYQLANAAEWDRQATEAARREHSELLGKRYEVAEHDGSQRTVEVIDVVARGMYRDAIGGHQLKLRDISTGETWLNRIDTVDPAYYRRCSNPAPPNIDGTLNIAEAHPLDDSAVDEEGLLGLEEE